MSNLTLMLEHGMESLCASATRRTEQANEGLSRQVTEAYALAARYREALLRIVEHGDRLSGDIAAKALGSPETAIEQARRLR